MSKFSLVILILCSIVSCKSKFELEDKLYSCNERMYLEKGYDLDKRIDEIENTLLKEQLLIDKKPKSYLKLIDNILKNDYNQILSVDVAKALQSIYVNLYCDSIHEKYKTDYYKSTIGKIEVIKNNYFYYHQEIELDLYEELIVKPLKMITGKTI